MNCEQIKTKQKKIDLELEYVVFQLTTYICPIPSKYIMTFFDRSVTIT